jgi:ubiquinone/menaquinone biosynthesis C-methylase UbiE
MKHQYWKNLVGFGFHLLYNELAWTYDLVSWLVSLGSWRNWQQAALPFVVGRQLLEVGHGPGHMLVALQAAGFSVFGLDLSAYMGRLAQKRTTVPLVQGRVQELPFAGASFDTVLSTFPTEYIVFPETLRAVHRVLRPNGRFIVVPEGHLTGTTPLHHFIEWLYDITGQRRGPFSLDEEHQWPHQDQWPLLQQHFQAAGFEMIREHIQLAHSSVAVLIAQKR